MRAAASPPPSPPVAAAAAVGDRGARAARFAALGDPLRLALCDELAMSDRTPRELADRLGGVASNLLAHHVTVLERAGLVTGRPSEGDRRRRYLRLVPGALPTIGAPPVSGPMVFVCTRNSARSQMAAALWRARHGTATSAGTAPAPRVHPGARRAVRRAGFDLDDDTTRHVDEVDLDAATVVTVCDRAHEDLGAAAGWTHWSVPDPVPDGRARAFDAALTEIAARIAPLGDAAGPFDAPRDASTAPARPRSPKSPSPEVRP